METRGKRKRCQYWASYRVYSHSVIQKIQRELRPCLPKNYTAVDQKDYHLTVHPQFQFPLNEIKTYEHYVRDIFPPQIEITVDSFYYHPSRAEPRVFCLEATTNIPFEKLQNRLTQAIDSGDSGRSILDPVAPHITLFSVDDPSQEMMRLPSNIDEIYETCDRLVDEELPVTFKETELQFSPTQEYDWDL